MNIDYWKSGAIFFWSWFLVRTNPLQSCDLPSGTSSEFYRQVSELKRVNHIWNANELSARDSVLIPIVKHSLLLDQDNKCEESKEKTSQTVDIRTISIKSLSDSADTQMFLERMNKDIETLLAATQDKTRKSSLTEVKSALTVERIFPKQVTSSRTGSSLCNNYILIFLAFCFLFLVIPLTLVYWEVIMSNVGK